MKVLGSFPIGYQQQRELAGMATIELPRSELKSYTLARAEIGDLFWLKEPWALVQSRQFGKQGIRNAIVGPVGTPVPAYLKPYMGDLRMSPQSAITLERGDSRCTLEVMGFSEHSIRVKVHMVNVDAFLRQRGAA